MNLHFKNGRFRIMQIADIQEDIPVNPDTIRLIDLALEREKPDLVVLTGDQVQGYSRCYRDDTYNKVRQCIDSFLEPVVRRGVPFCFTFGNHDDDCGISKAEQLKMYSDHPLCVLGETEDRLDEGTFSIKIKGSADDGDALVLYLVDTGKKQKDGKYAPMTKERIGWLKNQKKKNGYLPAVLFQHIPFPEYYEVLERCSMFRKGAAEAFHSRKNTYYTLPEKGREEGEFMGETPGSPEVNNGQFEEIKKDGDIFAVWVGHDHINSFRRNYCGVDLGYCQGAGFNTYGPGGKRGVRIFDFEESDVRNYKTHAVTASELWDFKPSTPVREFFFTHMPSSLDRAISVSKKVCMAAAVAAATGVLINKLI